MSFTKFELILENGNSVTCSQIGIGKRCGYIVGPGSFYFKGLASLYSDYTFITQDSDWTYRKPYGDFFQEKKVTAPTPESLIQLNHQVVCALKKQRNLSEIDGFGFSGPGALLFEQALKFPQDYAKLIGTGVGLIPLDPSFKNTDEIFAQRAEPERIKTHQTIQESLQKLQEYAAGQRACIDASVLLLFDLKPDGQVADKFHRKPHKRFVAEAVGLMSKLLFVYSDLEKSKAIILDHWKHNPANEHVDKRSQEHFFMTVYPKLDPAQAVMQLAKSNKPLLLLYGEADFITPLPKDFEKQMQDFKSVRVHILPKTAHMPYLEAPMEYAHAVRSFTQESKPIPSAPQKEAEELPIRAKL